MLGAQDRPMAPHCPQLSLAQSSGPRKCLTSRAGLQGLNKGILKFKNGSVPICVHLFSEYLLTSRAW